MAWGVRRRAIVAVRMERVEAGTGCGREVKTVSGSLRVQSQLVFVENLSGVTYASESLKAS